jgi:hypothetical protein
MENGSQIPGFNWPIPRKTGQKQVKMARELRFQLRASGLDVNLGGRASW